MSARGIRTCLDQASLKAEQDIPSFQEMAEHTAQNEFLRSERYSSHSSKGDN